MENEKHTEGPWSDTGLKFNVAIVGMWRADLTGPAPGGVGRHDDIIIPERDFLGEALFYLSRTIEYYGQTRNREAIRILRLMQTAGLRCMPPRTWFPSFLAEPITGEIGGPCWHSKPAVVCPFGFD